MNGIQFKNVKNLWLVVNKKTGRCVDLCHTRDIARDVKSKYGGAANSLTIVKYVLLEEIR